MGRMTTTTTLKMSKLLIPGSVNMLHGKRPLQMLLGLNILQQGDYPGFVGRPNLITCALKSRELSPAGGRCSRRKSQKIPSVRRSLCTVGHSKMSGVTCEG